MNIVKKIEFQNVNFSYSDNLFVYNKNINFEFQNGFSYLIKGDNGSGKTTLVDLLTKMLRNYTGSIRIDGEELPTISKKDIRDRIGVCFQKTPIFNDTLINNLIFDHEKNLDKLRRLDFFGVMKELGNRSVVNEINISGGQAQKIGIIRTLYVDKDLYIFDEPTSNLDKISCEKFWNKVDEIKQKKIVIIISHDSEAEKYVDYSFEL